jgi:hypothetical protein
MSVTVVVRSVPGLTLRCGTRMARPVRTDALTKPEDPRGAAIVKPMASERHDGSGERPERSDPSVSHLRWAVDIGVPFVSGSIRAHVDGEPVEVVEESAEGRVLLPADLPEGATVQLDYNATVLRAGPLQARVIGDVGRCIYCGSSDSLQREHVIPLALQGHFVLDRASCRRCAVSTGRMEQEMLRGWFLAPRTTLQLKTRRPRERPTALPGIVRRAGVDEEAMVPIDAYPSALIFPLFAPPVAIVDRPAVALQVTGGLRIVFVGRVPRRMLPQELGGDQIRVEVEGSPYAFAQMIAKIAWGFAVAAWGLEALAGSPIPAMVIGDRQEIGRWFGSAPDELPPTSEGLHAVMAWIAEDGRRLVRVKLFGQLGGPDYVVIVADTPRQ